MCALCVCKGSFWRSLLPPRHHNQFESPICATSMRCSFAMLAFLACALFYCYFELLPSILAVHSVLGAGLVLRASP